MYVQRIKAVGRHDHDICPVCKGDLCAGNIEVRLGAAVAKSYGDAKCFSNLVGIELPYDDPDHYDGVSFWECPKCDTRWDRFTGAVVKLYGKRLRGAN